MTQNSTSARPSAGRDIVLIAGLWLTGSAWDEVAAELAVLGHRPIAVTLPGQGDGARDATLDDQINAVLAAVDGTENPVVVGHSAACSLAWIAADRRADAVAGVALIGGFPSVDGEKYAEFFEIVDGAMPFPGWTSFEGADSADLSQQVRDRMAADSIPVPRGVAQGVVQLTDPRRFDVPVTLICPEFDPTQAKEWIASGDAPELAAAAALSFVDIDSGHWPMFTRPAELARLIDAIANAS